MNEETFKTQFISSFLAIWCANKYEECCNTDTREILNQPPVKDAEFLANAAWDEYVDKILNVNTG
ncbi:MAG: hypothetical protein H0V39_03350 [Nitrosomonas sp.]|nr:hypothetical protein [Nitrosomonas sp.]